MTGKGYFKSLRTIYGSYGKMYLITSIIINNIKNMMIYGKWCCPSWFPSLPFKLMHWSKMSDCYNPSSHLYTVIIKAGLDGIPILPLCFYVGLTWLCGSNSRFEFLTASNK